MFVSFWSSAFFWWLFQRKCLHKIEVFAEINSWTLYKVVQISSTSAKHCQDINASVIIIYRAAWHDKTTTCTGSLLFLMILSVITVRPGHKDVRNANSRLQSRSSQTNGWHYNGSIHYLLYGLSTQEKLKTKSLLDKAGGKAESQLVREAKQKQREERETDYSHRLITMYSPTLTGSRLGHNTHTWDLPLAERRAHLSQRGVYSDPLINNDATGFRHVHLHQLTGY